MKLKMFSMFDGATGVYLAPFPARSRIDAIRNVADGLRNPQMRDTPIVQHPEDFALYELGEFDDESGYMQPLAKPSRVSSVRELMAETPSGTVSS